MFFSFIVAIIGIVWTSVIVKELLNKEYERQNDAEITDRVETVYQEVDDTIDFKNQTSASE